MTLEMFNVVPFWGLTRKPLTRRPKRNTLSVLVDTKAA